MKNAEEAIVQVLRGLSDAKASPGMELRILQAVAARTQERLAARPRWAWSFVMMGAVAILMFIALATIYRHIQPPTQARQPALPAEPAANPQTALLPPHRVAAPARTAYQARKTPLISAADALLLSEMRAPSHPAPEAPLTNEEKLLLRAVHTGDPQVIAMLNPEERARQEAASEAEFQRFVKQSGKDVHESYQTTE
jgi:hypothetical protein